MLGISQNIANGGKAAGIKYFFVRPTGTTYGTGDGTSYENAWSGFAAVNQASVVSAGGRLAICGEHLETFTVTSNSLYIIGNHPAQSGSINGQNSRVSGMVIDGRADVTIESLTIINHVTQNLFLGNSSGTGSYSNIRTINCNFSSSGNQGIQHWGTAGSTATHINLTSNNNGDEAISGHQAGTINLFGGQFRSNAQAAINIIENVVVNAYNITDMSSNLVDFYIGSAAAGTPVCNVYNCRVNGWFLENSSARLNFYDSYIRRAPNNASTGITSDEVNGYVLMTRCFVDCAGATSTAAMEMDFRSGSTCEISYCIFTNMTTGRYAIGIRAGVTVTNISNCVFFGTNNVGLALFRALNFGVTNCIFRLLAGVDNNAGITYTNCSFTSNTAAPFGTQVNSVNSDPLFVNEGAADFRLQSGSPMINAGATVASYPTAMFSANWGSVNEAPYVVTKEQDSNFDIGAFVP